MTLPASFPPQIDDSWVLVLGGVTSLGHRRALRIVPRIATSDAKVIWLDGFQPRNSEASLSDAVELPSHVSVIASPRSKMAKVSEWLAQGGSRLNRPLFRRLWRKSLRRFGSALRPRASWQNIRTEVRQMATLPSPDAIVFCDDLALTSAWHCARIWPDTPVGSDWPVKST